jgi:hypothetical protein
MSGEIGGHKITRDSAGAVRIDDATLGTTQCYRIRRFIHTPRAAGPHDLEPAGVDMTETVWIDEASFLIRRIETRQMLTIDARGASEDLTVDGVTSYSPVLNEPVSSEALKFNAPASGRNVQN